MTKREIVIYYTEDYCMTINNIINKCNKNERIKFTQNLADNE